MQQIRRSTPTYSTVPECSSNDLPPPASHWQPKRCQFGCSRIGRCRPPCRHSSYTNAQSVALVSTLASQATKAWSLSEDCWSRRTLDQLTRCTRRAFLWVTTNALQYIYQNVISCWLTRVFTAKNRPDHNQNHSETPSKFFDLDWNHTYYKAQNPI